MRNIFTALIMMSFFTASAHAALLTNIQGPVSVNRGNGFQRVTAPTQVQPGDRVMVGNNGKAEIFYDSVCFNNLDAGKTIIVPQGVPCNTQAAAGQAASAGGIGSTALVVGGVVLVAGGVGLAIANSGGSKKPASP